MTPIANHEMPAALAVRIIPMLRGLLAQPVDNEDMPWRNVVLKSLRTPAALVIANQADSARPEAAQAGISALGLPACLPPLFLEVMDGDDDAAPSRARLGVQLEQYAALHGNPPWVIALPGYGLLYRQEPVKADQPLCGRVAVVTGAAGAIGHGICRGLLAQGAWVVATDLAGPNLETLVTELQAEAGERVIGVALDVTDQASVAGGFEQVIEAWGGVDMIVINAGIAHVAGLLELELETFRRLERVNVEGTLLTLAAGARVLKAQETGGDIVLVSTKNVFAPGARFGAYSATKAASHQLARIASLELAEFGIRVNMVAPDAVFGEGRFKSGLWAAVGPDRMKARGLSEQGLEDYYRSRNLLKARVTARHVANAVLFFVTHQTPTTGATIPIDGGLPDATPR